MEKEIIGKISGVLVLASAIPYAVRVYQKKITPNIVSWFIWSVLGGAILANYKSSGAHESIYPAIFGFTNPDKDRPLMWLLYAFGYGLAIFAISEQRFSNYILPVYMFVGAILVATPLVIFRIKNRLGITEWI